MNLKKNSVEGKFLGSITELDIKGISMDEFLGYFHKMFSEKDDKALMAGHPEHYAHMPSDEIESAEKPDNVTIETVGGYKGPWKFYVKFYSNHADAVVTPDPSYERFMIGDYCNLDGGFAGVKVLHQFKNTPDGFHAQVGLYFPSNAPEDLVKGHQYHLAIEFKNWIEAAYKEISAQKKASRS